MSYTMSGGKFSMEERGYTFRRAVLGWILGTIVGTWFGVWASGPAAPELRSRGMTLSTFADRPYDAYAERVERPGSPARMILHLPGEKKMRREKQ